MANKRGHNAAKSKPEAPAVKTYADHEVIMPAHRLRAAVVADAGDSGPDPVLQAEQALAQLSTNFAEWMQAECDRLDAARGKAGALGFDPENRDELFRAAHDIKGEAATFGFPLVAPVAASLCRLIEHSPEGDRIPGELVDQHIDAIKAIIHGNARGEPGQVGPLLAERLRVVTDEFLRDVNRHRPEYLDGIIAPPLAPSETF